MQDKEYHNHKIFRAGWLRAAVLGANDGIISTASLIAGMAAINSDYNIIITTGFAGLISGALSMSAGEYVSVCSQSDIEIADLKLEALSLKNNSEYELQELTQIYIDRGLSKKLAYDVAVSLTKHNALDAHARDELGISMHNRANPIKAAIASFFSFSTGATLPMLVALLSPVEHMIFSIITSSVLWLATLGIISAHTGGAKILPATTRVSFVGAAAMAITALIGKLFGT
ncbi:hypothetical protein CKSOR_00319 [Candidatus Kinetoplastibacterium sorsogonicusi]|uniref:VIT family protein n=1 Tax=Candidatus Kinetoplastidibacterium kentomonadis TaxID=1576550 RepID=A0A3S7J9U5_9PROT|nr:VIT family protein [Candidatus Kinetoplastibacterium sorsogonicusi]AWD32440.1 hypothetical protein CKSOR_00319 [Candidatus Kinetoplastibacterium sorsogonicusi]